MAAAKRQSILSLFLYGMVSIIVLLSVFHCAELYYFRHQEFTKEVSRLEDIQLIKQKDVIQREVDSAIESIRFHSAQMSKQAKASLQQRVMEAYAIASQLYTKYKGQKSQQEILELICEALREIRFNHGRGYYFVLKLDGTIAMLPIQPEREGWSLLQASPRERHFAEELIALARKPGEGFYQYRWQKPGQGDQLFPKLSFIKSFAPGDWLIGTGEYLDDLEREIKAAAIERVSSIRFGGDGFLFAMDYDSKMIAHAEPGLVGNRMLDSEFPQIRAVFPKMLALSAKQGAFVEYRFRRPQHSSMSLKVSYVARMEEWQWMVGAGFFLDSLEEAIADKRNQLRHALFSDILQMMVVSLISIALAALIVRLGSRKLHQNISLFNEFFSRAASQSITLGERDVIFSEFDQMAGAINHMVEERGRIEADRKQLEAQLMQKQKLEAVGTLAGGIAHDFNNLLTVMFGNISLLSLKVDHHSELYKYILRIQESAYKARDLVAQILSFSRHSEGEKKLLDLNQTVRESLSLLRATIPTTVNLKIDLPLQRFPVVADKTQIHQVVMNLCSNACHALPHQTGTILVTLTSLVGSDQPALLSRMSTKAKNIAHLQVSDNGVGILPEIIEKIFDPFFSTKSKGEGTGLGLSIAHRIIRQCGGLLEVDSESGKGASFNVYLPQVEATETDFFEAESMQIEKGRGTLLLVDDDPAILESSAECLEQLGYTVITAPSAADALVCIANREKEILAMITDQTMPGMTGLELIDEARTIFPDLPIILCTGFSEQVDQQTIEDKKPAGFLMKPIYLPELSQLLRKCTRQQGVS